MADFFNIQDKPPFLAGSYTGTGTATLTFTVTMGTTMPLTNFKVQITPTNALSSAIQYVTNKTVNTFDVTFVSALTGAVAFDWLVIQ